MSNDQSYHQACFGYCRACDEIHSLPGGGKSKEQALLLMEQFDQLGRIDVDVSDEEADPRFSTACLFGQFRGQMFGVMECLTTTGETVFIKAFSCQHDGVWMVEGWVPPLVDVDDFAKIVSVADKKIKSMCREIDALPADSEEKKELRRVRKKYSQNHMKDIHRLYSLHNFKGQESTLREAFYVDKGMPTGAGDCCAPKLLNYAALNDLMPVTISEFYYGLTTKSKSRQHKAFYECCKEKCQPILGFLLCGLPQ